jgi:hypothetical protein
MRDSVDSYLTAYTHDGFDPVGYPYGQVPEYSTDDIPMAETAYGATFGDLGHRRHHHHHGHRGPGPGWWGWGPGWPGWGWPYPELVGVVVPPDPVVLDESGGGTFDEEDKKKEKGTSGLSSFVMKRLHEVARDLPQAERKMFLAEIKDPGFVAYIARYLHGHDPVRDIMDDALRAVANEFNPRLYPMTRGHWKHLRGVAKTLTVDIAKMIDKQVEGMPLERKLAVYEKFREAGMAGGSGLGWVDALVSTIAGAAGSIYSAKLQSSTAKDIAKIQATAATKQVELQTKMAQAQMAMQQAQMAPAPGAPGYVAPSKPGEIMGIPWWGLLLGVGALGAGVVLLTRK